MTKYKKSILISAISFVLLAIVIITIFLVSPKNPNLNLNTTLGVWWWDNTLDQSYLDFASDNGVDEIYYCDSSMNSDTASFIQKAKKQNIKVYLLVGEKEWILDNTSLVELIAEYNEFQISYPNSNFSGIHLDIEPHQYDNFEMTDEDENYTAPPEPFETSTWREYYFYKYVELVYTITDNFAELAFDFDIPFWANDEITYNGVTKPVYEHVIDKANRTFIMSYRDSGENMVSVASEELAYAKSCGKTIFLGAETSEQDPEFVSYFEEGKKHMYKELTSLKDLTNQNYGVAIHHIKSWKNLKD